MNNLLEKQKTKRKPSRDGNWDGEELFQGVDWKCRAYCTPSQQKGKSGSSAENW